jgi:hypothetical protein
MKSRKILVGRPEPHTVAPLLSISAALAALVADPDRHRQGLV